MMKQILGSKALSRALSFLLMFSMMFCQLPTAVWADDTVAALYSEENTDTTVLTEEQTEEQTPGEADEQTSAEEQTTADEQGEQSPAEGVDKPPVEEQEDPADEQDEPATYEEQPEQPIELEQPAVDNAAVVAAMLADLPGMEEYMLLSADEQANIKMRLSLLAELAAKLTEAERAALDFSVMEQLRAFAQDKPNAFLVFAAEVAENAPVASLQWYGDGTAKEFEIATAADLLGLAQLVNGTAKTTDGSDMAAVNFKGKTLKLTADIDLDSVCHPAGRVEITPPAVENTAADGESGTTEGEGGTTGGEGGTTVSREEVSWTPIGSTDKPFAGVLDGDNHKIANLYINGEQDCQGLFGYVKDPAAEIKNLTVGGSVSGKDNVGLLVGQAGLELSANGKVYVRTVSCIITNCRADGEVSGGTNIGLLAGAVSTVAVSGCQTAGSVNASGNNAGGMIGLFADLSNNAMTNFSDNTNAAEVKVEGDNVGGLIGELRYNRNKLAEADKFQNNANLGNISGRDMVGGIIGMRNFAFRATTSQAKPALPATNCQFQGQNLYNGGTVSATGDNCGAIMGYNAYGGGEYDLGAANTARQQIIVKQSFSAAVDLPLLPEIKLVQPADCTASFYLTEAPDAEAPAVYKDSPQVLTRALVIALGDGWELGADGLPALAGTEGATALAKQTVDMTVTPVNRQNDTKLLFNGGTVGDCFGAKPGEQVTLTLNFSEPDDNWQLTATLDGELLTPELTRTDSKLSGATITYTADKADALVIRVSNSTLKESAVVKFDANLPREFFTRNGVISMPVLPAEQTVEFAPGDTEKTVDLSAWSANNLAGYDYLTFEGWYTDKAGTTAWDNKVAPANAKDGLTLYAKWTDTFGTGTADAPQTLDAAGLRVLSLRTGLVFGGKTYDYDGAYFKLDDGEYDLAPYQNWLPIGYRFADAGDFKANISFAEGVKIKNLQIDMTKIDDVLKKADKGVGLFCQLPESITEIENLTISGRILNAADCKYVGGLAGRAHTSAEFRGCQVDMQIAGGEYSGGLIGYLKVNRNGYNASYNAQNCRFIGSVTGQNSGGLFGVAEFAPASSSTKITAVGCVIEGSITGDKFAGGIAAAVERDCQINAENCANLAAINGDICGGLFGQYSGSSSDARNSSINGCFSAAENLDIVGQFTSVKNIDHERCYIVDTLERSYNMAEGKTAAEFKSGEVAWLLDKGDTAERLGKWGQIGDWPSFGEAPVYRLTMNGQTSYKPQGAEIALTVPSGKILQKLLASNDAGQEQLLGFDAAAGKFAMPAMNAKVTPTFAEAPKGSDAKVQLTFKPNGGEVNGSANDVVVEVTGANNWHVAVNLPQPTKSGFDFLGWFLDGTNIQVTDENKASISFVEAAVLMAKWRAENADLAINFNLNGGDAPAPEAQYIATGDKITKPADPTRAQTETYAGWIFDGWYNLPVGGDVWDFNTALTADLLGENKELTLFAHWRLADPYSDPTKPEDEKTEHTLATADDWYKLGWSLKNGANKDNYAGHTFTVTADVELGADKKWTPIGDENHKFAGNIEGGGHTVTLHIENETLSALFAMVENSRISNLITDGEVKGDHVAAGLVAMVYGKDNFITNCTNNAKVQSNCVAGGVVGLSKPAAGAQNNWNFDDESYYTTCGWLAMVDCENNGDITAGSWAGGIIGLVAGVLEDCRNNGKITTLGGGTGGFVDGISNGGNVGAGTYAAGGITAEYMSIKKAFNTQGEEIPAPSVDDPGYQVYSYEGYVTFKNCQNTGEIDGSLAPYAGGIMGWANTNQFKWHFYTMFDGCENSGSVKSTQCAGGMAGLMGNNGGNISYGCINASVNKGEITVNASGNKEVNIGGLAGKGYVYVQNSRNEGDVTVSGSAGDVYAAGLVTKTAKDLDGVEFGKPYVNNSNTGNITVETGNSVYAGGLFGIAAGDMHFTTIKDSYNTGNLNITPDNRNSYVGGIIGRLPGVESNNEDGTRKVSKIENSYSSGELVVGGTSHAGAVLGGLNQALIGDTGACKLDNVCGLKQTREDLFDADLPSLTLAEAADFASGKVAYLLDGGAGERANKWSHNEGNPVQEENKPVYQILGETTGSGTLTISAIKENAQEAYQLADNTVSVSTTPSKDTRTEPIDDLTYREYRWELDSLKVYVGDTLYKDILADGQFTMPKNNAVVKAVFAEHEYIVDIPQPGDDNAGDGGWFGRGGGSGGGVGTGTGTGTGAGTGAGSGTGTPNTPDVTGTGAGAGTGTGIGTVTTVNNPNAPTAGDNITNVNRPVQLAEVDEQTQVEQEPPQEQLPQQPTEPAGGGGGDEGDGEEDTEPVQMSFFEVIRHTLQENPLITALMLILILLIIAAAGYNRYRKNKKQS